MASKFQQLIDNIMENMNAAGAGGALGTPQQAVYNPPSNVNSGDTYAPNNAMNLFGFPKVAKRKKPELLVFGKSKRKPKKKRK
jgi:hypothetical protein